MQAAAQALSRTLEKWVLAGAALSALLATVVQLHALEELVDRPVALFFASQRDATLVHIARFLTDFGKAYWFIVPAAALFILFRFMWKNPLYASRSLFVLTSVASTGIIVDVLKVVFGRARPELLFNQDIFQFFFFRFGHEYNSFPSGHTACAMAAGVALALIFPRYRSLALAGAAILACTRFITTAHYISDVVASSIIAVVVVPIIQIVFARFGFPLNEREASMDLPRHRLPAKMIGTPLKAGSIDGAVMRATTPTIVGVVIAATIMAVCGLAPNLALIEWQEGSLPDYQPVLEWWLWLSLYVCLGFGALTWACQRKLRPI
ncbi:MAG: phosphatase PAP2 family protein [Mesorhizobium sp.]